MSNFTLEHGDYFIGGVVYAIDRKKFKSLIKEQTNGVIYIPNYCCIKTMPYVSGTFYDNNVGLSYGFDNFLFGCIKFSEVLEPLSFQDHKYSFYEEFECIFKEDKLFFGDKIFSTTPTEQTKIIKRPERILFN